MATHAWGQCTRGVSRSHDLVWDGEGLLHLSQAGGRTHLVEVDIGLPREVENDRIVRAVLEDERGILWVGDTLPKFPLSNRSRTSAACDCFLINRSSVWLVISPFTSPTDGAAAYQLPPLRVPPRRMRANAAP